MIPFFFEKTEGVAELFPLTFKKHNLNVKGLNFIYINYEENKICAIIRLYIVEYEGIYYAYIYAVGSRAYYDLEYKGYGRKIFNELFDILKYTYKVSVVCIFDTTVVGYEMYIKIGFRIVGRDIFLYKMLNDKNLNCNDICVILSIEQVLVYGNSKSAYLYLDEYPFHKKQKSLPFDRVRQDEYRPYTDQKFIEDHTDLFNCEHKFSELDEMYIRMKYGKIVS
jgi:hypothetical protein